MATIKFLIRGKGETVSIYLRLLNGRKTDITTSTGYLVNSKHWSKAKGKIKPQANFQGKLNLENDLKELKRDVIDRFNEDTTQELNLIWLKTVIAEYKDPSLKIKTNYLIDHLEKYKEGLKTRINPKTGVAISKHTIKNFGTTIKHVEQFEVFKKKRVALLDVNLEFHKDFNEYAQTILKLKTNTISKDFRQIKTGCFEARDNGFDINRQVESRKFSSPNEPTTFVTLSIEDLNEIRKFQGSDYLENARDWLIIGCWTGCRVTDLMNLSSSNVKQDSKGRNLIRYTQSKTKKTIEVLIHPHVKEIITRLSGFPRSISDQKFNDYIKKVCEKVEVTKFKAPLVMTHTCRRSFATNHYNKLSNKKIMAVTGHSTELMLLKYIGAVEVDHLDDYVKLYEN